MSDRRAVTKIGIPWRQESCRRADKSERSKALDLRLSDYAYSFRICLINNNRESSHPHNQTCVDRDIEATEAAVISI